MVEIANSFWLCTKSPESDIMMGNVVVQIYLKWELIGGNSLGRVILEIYPHLIFGSLKYVVFGIIVMQNFCNSLSTFLCQIIGMCYPWSLDRIKLERCYLLHIGKKLSK